MNRIKTAFETRLMEESRVFIPYLCSGDPTLDISYELINVVEDAGADILELGIPFSDPLADGPTIQQATKRSLENGTRIRQAFDLIDRVRNDSELPIVVMTYYNPIYRYGEEHFLREAAEAGADGILVVDLPPEEGLQFYEQVPDYGLETILLATPTTQLDRVEALSELATGFLYYVLVTGVTGVRSDYDTDLGGTLRMVSDRSRLPTVVGFGVSDVSAIEDYLGSIQGVVVGSYLIEGINKNIGDNETIRSVLHARASEIADPLHSRSY